jgi:hypothetical protein
MVWRRQDQRTHAQVVSIRKRCDSKHLGNKQVYDACALCTTVDIEGTWTTLDIFIATLVMRIR